MISLGIYHRQLIFWILPIILLGLLIWYLNSRNLGAGAPNLEQISDSQPLTLDLTIADGGKVFVNGKAVKNSFSFGHDDDRLEYQVYDKEGKNIEKLNIAVHWSGPTTSGTAIVARQFTDGTFTTNPPVIEGDQIQFTAFNIGPQSVYSIEIIFPKGLVRPSLISSIRTGLFDLPVNIWLVISLVLSIMVLVMILWLLRHRLAIGIDKSGTLDHPPGNIAPAVVAILVNGRVSPRCLAATLLDLANRGFLQMIVKRHGYSLGKYKRTDINYKNKDASARPLSPFEKLILAKIFASDDQRSSEQDLRFMIGQNLFSRQVAQSYLEIYNQATMLGWFHRSPQQVYSRYRLIALVVILAAFVGALLNYFAASIFAFGYLWGWILLFALGLVMYYLIPFLPKRTGRGQIDYQGWIKFRNYLALNKPIEIELTTSQSQQLYQRFLPYAIVLGVEVEWTRRFARLPFHVPDWYVSEQDIRVIEEFVNELFPLLSNIAYELARARSPFVI